MKNEREVGVILKMLAFVVLLIGVSIMAVVAYREGLKRVVVSVPTVVEKPYNTTVKERILNMFRYAEFTVEEGAFIAEYDFTNVTDFYLPDYRVHVGFDFNDNLIYAVLPEAIADDIVTKSTDGQTRDTLIQRGFEEVLYNGERAYIKNGVKFVGVSSEEGN